MLPTIQSFIGFLKTLYDVIGNHTTIDSIDCTIEAGKFDLLKLLALLITKNLFRSDSETNNTSARDLVVKYLVVSSSHSKASIVLQQPKLPSIESELNIDDAEVILRYISH